MKKTEIGKLVGRPIFIERRGTNARVIGLLTEVTNSHALIMHASKVCDEDIPILSQIATGGLQTISIPLNQIERVYEIETD